MEISFDIPQGYYTKQELESYIQNSLSKIGNIPINAYSSTEGNISIPSKDFLFDNGNQKVFKKEPKNKKN